MNANYTWSHTLDQGGVAFGSSAQDDTSYRDEYGNPGYDVRHYLQFDYTYELRRRRPPDSLAVAGR